MSVTSLTRCFRFGSIELPDVPGVDDPKAVLKLYEGNYPELALAELGTPVRDGDRLVYEVIRPAVKTKG
jgi:PRTRC genetic system protein C